MAKTLNPRNVDTLNTLIFFGCENIQLYATSVLVTSFYFLKIFMIENLQVINEWNAREIEARNSHLTNPKHAGRKRCPMDVVLACCIIRTALGLSDLQIVQRVHDDNFVRSVLFALIDRRLDKSELPSHSTLQKYQSQWSHDKVIDLCTDRFTSIACMYAQAHADSPARVKAIEHLPVSEEQKELIKNFGTCSIVDSAFISTEINHLTKDYYNALKEGKGSQFAGLLTYQSESHKRMEGVNFGCKYGKFYHGVKLHLSVEATTGIAIGYTITEASVNDVSQLLDVEANAKRSCPNLCFCLGDSIYNSVEHILELEEKQGITLLANNKRTRKPLTTQQLEENHKLGRLRCFVEHAFSFIKHTLKLKPYSVELPRIHMDCKLALVIYNAYRLAKVL